MELDWDKEKKLLSLLDDTRVIYGKISSDYAEKIKSYVSFSDEELKFAIERFVKKGLLREIKLGEEDCVYFHTKKVSKDMIDGELTSFGKVRIGRSGLR